MWSVSVPQIFALIQRQHQHSWAKLRCHPAVLCWAGDAGKDPKNGGLVFGQPSKDWKPWAPVQAAVGKIKARWNESGLDPIPDRSVSDLFASRVSAGPQPL